MIIIIRRARSDQNAVKLNLRKRLKKKKQKKTHTHVYVRLVATAYKKRYTTRSYRTRIVKTRRVRLNDPYLRGAHTTDEYLHKQTQARRRRRKIALDNLDNCTFSSRQRLYTYVRVCARLAAIFVQHRRCVFFYFGAIRREY